MSLSEAELFGLGRTVRTLYVENRADLEAGAVDVDAVLAELDGAQGETETANAVQEDRKRLAREATQDFLPKKARFFHVTSNALDMAIAAVGKETIAGKNFRKLRSDITRESARVEAAETPGGVPPESPR